MQAPTVSFTHPKLDIVKSNSILKISAWQNPRPHSPHSEPTQIHPLVNDCPTHQKPKAQKPSFKKTLEHF
jgi:hypothetical protein